jgi:hypothetical protein
VTIPTQDASPRGWTGALFHASGGLLIFILWKFMGLPENDSMGLLVPLAWLLTGGVYGRGGIPRLSVPLLGLHVLLTLVWTSGCPSQLLAKASAVGALFPGLVSLALDRSKRLGYLRFALPILPLVILTVPFSGDEPFHASIAEQMVSPGAEKFGGLYHQRGDPTGLVTHHQRLYPLFLIPGYPFGIPGIRTVASGMALGAAALLAMLLRRGGVKHWRMAVFLGLVTVPGIGVLGTVYPTWMALIVFLAAAIHVMRTRSFLWAALATFFLAMIKVRFAPLGIGLVVAAFLSTPGRRKYLILLSLLGGLALLLAADHFLIGGQLFLVRYGNSVSVRSVLANIALRPHQVLFAAAGALLDTEAGLLWKSPWILLSLAGIPRLRREHRDLFLWMGLPALLYLLTLFIWTPTDWHGAPTPTGRMLLPAIPFLLASMTMTLKSRSAGWLIGLSLAVSAFFIVSPGLRFNDADGTDCLFTALLGPGNPALSLLPSVIRPVLLPFLISGCVAAVLIWMAARNRGNAAFLLLPAAVLMGAASQRTQTSWEAEDLSPVMMSGCDYYPGNTDPFIRKFWLECRQIFLTMETPGDEVRIPVPDWDADSVTFRVHYRTLSQPNQPRLLIECCGESDTLRKRSRLLDPPPWFLYMTGGGRRAKNEPGNMRELIADVTFPNPGFGGEIVLKPVFPTGQSYRGRIYLDRLEIVR